VFVPHQLLYFTGLRCCCVCPTPIALFHRFKMLLCLSKQLVWDKHNNILSLWNQTILVYKHNNILSLWNQTITTIVWFHRLKMLLCLSHTNCFISQVEDIVVFFPHQLLYFKGLRCWCVCPTPIAWNKAIGVGQTQQHLESVK
jgi:hypothetical protein